MLWIVLGAVSLGVLGMTRGCTSAALPPMPLERDLATVRATHFGATIAVEAYKHPVYSQRLVEALRSTGLFDEVDTLENLPDADLVARVERHIYGTATVPIFTLLTLGIVPSTVDEEWGESFTFRRNGADEPTVPVEFSYVGKSTLGWVAGIKSISSDVTNDNPRETRRFHEAFSVVICSNAEAIESLLNTP